MADEVVDPLGEAMRRQRSAVLNGQFLTWRGMILQRQVDDVLLTGLEGSTDAFVSAVELGVAGTRSVLDPLDSLLSTADGPGLTRRTLDRPLELSLSASRRLDGHLYDAAEGLAIRVEDHLRRRILRLNSRLNSLMDRHERLERRLREFAGQYDDPTGVSEDIHDRLAELQERVEELRERVAELRETLDTRPEPVALAYA